MNENRNSLKCLKCPNGEAKISKEELKMKFNCTKKIITEKIWEICTNHQKEENIFCKNCSALMCQECFDAHKLIKALKEHTVSDPPKENRLDGRNYCKEHKNMEYYYQCLQCNVHLCEVCKSIGHQNHKVDYILTYFKAKKDKIILEFKLPAETSREFSDKLKQSQQTLKENLNLETCKLKDQIQQSSTP
jgi:hypothetical protein